MRTQLLIAAILGLAASVGGTARADVIFNSLDQTYDGSNSIASIQPIGASFSTGSTLLLLDDVQLYLSNSTPGTGTGSILVQLYSDPSDVGPTTLVATLGTLADSASTGTAEVYDFSSFAPVSLSADTRYWVELSTTNGSNYGLIYTSNDNGLGVAGEYYQYAGGIHANAGPPPAFVGADEMIISAVVPEPSSLLLCGVAGLMGVAYRARRGRRGSADR